MPNYLWQCQECHLEIEVFRPVAQYEEPPSTKELANHSEVCQHTWTRLISQVNFQSTERHYGKQERAQNRSFQELKESYQIEKEMVNLPHDKRTDHQTEIKKLRSIDGKS